MAAHAAPGSVRKRDQAYPWTVVGITLALSMAGNAVHAVDAHTAAVSDRTAAFGAVVPPILAALALHGLLRVLRRTPPGWQRNIVVALVVAVFGMAFAISFAGLHAFAVAIGIRGFLALFGPLIVDVTTVYAVADAMLLHHRPAVPAVTPVAASEPTRAPELAAGIDLRKPAHEPAPAAQPLPLDEAEPARAADGAHTAPIPRTPAPVRTLDDAATQRAQVCAHIAQLRATPGAHVSSRGIGREFGVSESTVRQWIGKLAAGEWAVTPDGTLITGIPRERTG